MKQQRKQTKQTKQKKRISKAVSSVDTRNQTKRIISLLGWTLIATPALDFDEKRADAEAHVQSKELNPGSG